MFFRTFFCEYLCILFLLRISENKEERKKEEEEKKAVYAQREPLPLSGSSVCHFVVGVGCSVIYSIAP